MLGNIIQYSINNKFIVILFTIGIISMGIYSLLNIPIGAVPDVTNNQVQVITTSKDLSTQDVEQFLTYPVELEMTNLPGIVEIRSISKFGLSVVTIVFEDKMGTYLPRQLIAEKLKAVEEKIPAGFGSPSMGPISTGLGEIYQYILDVKPEFSKEYDVSDLRTIQDWIVKRQLSGIPGVVEVNTWGGFLKTYEVAVNPQELRAMDITLKEVYEALEKNNSISGGGYIEKTNEAYFIRAEGLVTGIEDIENIVVSRKGEAIIYVKDVANVAYGAATRFGAITGNGTGEKVLGQVMMLKGANSKQVIESVIERVSEIQASLPEGVFINPFLERSELIEKTTHTIIENLVLGFLIVLFVVVFLLGNIQSGLLVASVIPLTLLFALTMMYFFGVDANLMSLGAIDFGIIIDGAVIIVEYIAYTISQNADNIFALEKGKKQAYIDKVVSSGAKKMMNSAVFGQIIIVIVFIPILTLSGTEGKMFKPMALTFCFALIGAMILCFTYVPVMSSLFLKPSKSSKRNISDMFVFLIKKMYQPILEIALKFKAIIISLAVFALVGTGILFNNMGGEFIPTLDEGDFVIQPVLKTGMSLAETVKMTTRMEKILLRFPEVKQVVSRIGAAEVPTDPMSMEESDIIITLKKKSEWVSAATKDELADVFKLALIKEIPGVEIEFTQPIEMRFNELITGVRADVAIKLFGDDLNILYKKATEIQNAIKNVEGAADISVEKIDGLPQMTVKYDRKKIALHGLNIDDLNDVVAMGFAGKSAGFIFEGERQFDIVIRYEKKHREDLNSLKNAIVDLPNGQRKPLSEFADISFTKGPAKISRDDTKRRVVVGVNVRGRDLESVVNEIRGIVDEKVELPSGYHIKYGGQFENLQDASRRLMVAVPIALVLILILLYFAFGSIKEALLIYTAIPLAAIGGVLALYLRDLPFSISAGVGFIALFGIAVLNGIVMIEHFKELKHQGMDDVKERVITGALDRIRPVLLTAIAAALGFLPMAISASAGAEVQRPLATVVIGGLISSTLLTLLVLPILYSVFEKKESTQSKPKPIIGILLAFVFIPFFASAQNTLSLEEAIAYAKKNQMDIKANDMEVKRQTLLVDATKEIGKTDFYYEYDRNNLSEFGDVVHVFGAGQSFKLPAVHAAKKELQLSAVGIQEQQNKVQESQLFMQIHQLYEAISYHDQLISIYEAVDSIYADFQKTVELKYQLGESDLIEKMTAMQKRSELFLRIKDAEGAKAQLYYELEHLIGHKGDFEIKVDEYSKLSPNMIDLNDHPLIGYHNALIDWADKKTIAGYKEILPEINVSVFNGFSGIDNFRFSPGIQAGVSIPLVKKQYKVQKQADEIYVNIQKTKLEQAKIHLQHERDKLEQKLSNIDEKLAIYETTISTPSTELLKLTKRAMDEGEIDYFQYLLTMENSRILKIKNLELIHEYNQTIISLNYLTNQ